MPDFRKPTVVISKCLEFNHCRYDGSMIASDFVRKIKPFITAIPVCPEAEIGLGIPRKSLRLVTIDGEPHLVQPATGVDATEEMNTFANNFFTSLPSVQGFILKTRSPSCGIKDVKLYAKIDQHVSAEKTTGLFGGSVLDQFQGYPIETEGRLRNVYIQEHFLVQIFSLAAFEAMKKTSSISALIEFHTRNKFLLMAYNQQQLKILGNIVAQQKDHSFDEVIQSYQHHLLISLEKPPSKKTTKNVLLHLFGFVSEHLSAEEKKFFLDMLENYNENKIPLGSISYVLKSWIVRFAEPYLSKQSFFSPFPEDLMDEQLSMIADSQRYWK